VTGLANRETFLAALGREWHLARRGTVESYAVALELTGLDEVGARYGEAMVTLLLKAPAEVLSSTARRTDHVGRISNVRFGAVLVGCEGQEGVKAFVGRYGQAIERLARTRPEGVTTVCAFKPLAGVEAPEDALDFAERRAAERAQDLVGDATLGGAPA